MEKTTEITDLLNNLTSQDAISGFEFDFSAYLAEFLRPYCTDVSIDAFGNVIAKKTQNRKKKVLLEAHIDQIGLMVSHIEENGVIRFVPIGGINPAFLPATEVTIHGKQDFFGIIGTIPPHLQSADKENEVINLKDLYIDIGMDYDSVMKNISVGDVVSYKAYSYKSNSKFTAKSLDNRAGIAVLLQTAMELKNCDLPYDVTILLSVQEEVGLRGAPIATFNEEPDIALVVDVTYGSAFGTKDDETFALGSGAAIAIGPNAEPELYSKIKNAAEQLSLPHTTEVLPSHSGTNAWAIQTVSGGVPCAILSVPLRYMHTPYEMVDTKDIETMVRLITSILKEGNL